MAVTAPKIKLIPLAVAVFALGLVAIVVTFGSYALGYRYLTGLLYLGCMLVPLGFGLGLIALLRQFRQSRRGPR